MQRPAKHTRRRGATLIITLVSLAVAMTLLVGWARVALLQSRESRATEDRLQAIWLAESALDRGAARWRENADYEGETWLVAAEEFGRVAGPAADGVAVIAVEPVADRPTARRIKVQADFPATGRRAHRVSKQILVDAPGRKEIP